MQDSEPKNSNEVVKKNSELRIEYIAGAAGTRETPVFAPPRAIIKQRGESCDVDNRPVANACLETPVLSVPTSNYSASISTEKRITVPSVRPITQPEVLVRLSVEFARETCPSDAIVHRHLQELQATVPSEYIREEKLWIPRHSAQDICDALKCFINRSKVSDAIDRLKEYGKIETESTGKFLEPYQRTGGKTDLATWFRVPAPLSAEGIMSFRAADAIRYDISKAMILSVYHASEIGKFDKEGRMYKKMSAAELAKELPLTEQAIGPHLRKLIKDGVFVPHPKSAKYVRFVDQLPK